MLESHIITACGGKGMMANTPCTYRGGEAGGGQHHELRDGHDDEALVGR